MKCFLTVRMYLSISKAKPATGAADNCYDILVTENGHDNESVIGWITNDIINENAKV